jgi:hypothetical protein
MRIRSIKPEFFDDQTVNSWSPLTRLLYVGLWVMADDCGRFQADIDTIKASVCKKDRPSDVEKSMDELVKSGKVMLYASESGEKFGVVSYFWHQKVDRPQPAQWPCPPEDVCLSIVEKSLKNKRMRDDLPARLRRIFDDASPIVRRMIDEWSPPSRVRALEQGSKGAREQVYPQTIDECIALAEGIGMTRGMVEKFFAHYRSIGWKKGINGFPIEDVKAALSSWKMNDPSFQSGFSDSGSEKKQPPAPQHINKIPLEEKV